MEKISREAFQTQIRKFIAGRAAIKPETRITEIQPA
jgi:hypothetical protein